MTAFVMAKSLQGDCTVCGERVSEGQIFVWESDDDLRANRPTHRPCSMEKAKPLTAAHTLDVVHVKVAVARPTRERHPRSV